MQILSCVWGKTHLELFKKASLRSLSWPKNRESIKGSTWNIYTNDEDIDSLNEYTKALLPEVNFMIMSTSALRNYIDQVQSATLWQIEECLRLNERLLLSPPDTIFGDGSVEGLIQAGLDPGSVVVSPHPRVLEPILKEITHPNYKPSNGDLVGMAWFYLHDSWIHAERGHPNQSSYVGGVEWWRKDGIIYGTHRLPSPYLLHFTEEDLSYFKSQVSFGSFDHLWGGDILIPRGRQRYLASSEACFIVEITEAVKNVPPIIENQPKTGFWRDHLHNKMNAQIIFTFKGVDE